MQASGTKLLIHNKFSYIVLPIQAEKALSIASVANLTRFTYFWMDTNYMGKSPWPKPIPSAWLPLAWWDKGGPIWRVTGVA